MSNVEELQRIIDELPGGFTKLVQGVNVVSIDHENKKVSFELPVTDKYLNGYGTLHGGMIAYLIDMCGTFSLSIGSFAIILHGNGSGVSADISVSYCASAKKGIYCLI